MSEIRILEVDSDEREFLVPAEHRSSWVEDDVRARYIPAEIRKLEVLLP